jgi:type VI protein secretion system component VasF
MSEQTTTTNGSAPKTARKTRAPAEESREDKFVRLAVQRMNALRGKIRQVKNLARYPHTEEQAKRIVSELKAFAADIEGAFVPREKNEDFRF